MACDLFSVGYEGNSCVESFAGTGIDVIFFKAPDTAPTYSEEKNRFDDAAFTGVVGYKVKIKADSGEVTWTANGNNAGYTAVANFLVDGDINKMAVNNRTLSNLGGKFGVAVPVGTVTEGEATKTLYDVIYDHTRGVKFEVSGTSGKAASDEKGHTITVTCGTMLYGPTQWAGEFTEPTA